MSGRSVYLVVPDLLFATRITETARQHGVEALSLVRTQVLERCRERPPDLVILDLEAPDDPVALVREFKNEPRLAAVPLVAYYPHVERHLYDAARAAGADQILPRSAFTVRLVEILTGERRISSRS
ncbi:MAG TPA: hypothetical protein VEY91_02940 [Candidatus Limnocylindria bacterium]|nr:hypothetical protein [Candidatus Limnocylindria bacterium]